MKSRLIKHIEMVFKALSIESSFDIFDCENDEMPHWTSVLSHEFKYFICSSAIEKKDKLSSFLGREISVCGNMIYWYDGDRISLIKNIVSSSESENFGENLTSINIKLLKTNTRLPIWLDDYIFKTLKAQYSPNHERFDFNLDLSESDILKYLGTYFPRSYGESFCIFDNLFQNKAYNTLFNLHDRVINIAVIGCGTGGDLLGILTVIEKYTEIQRNINIVAIDGNVEALQIMCNIIERYTSICRHRISLKTIHYTFGNISNFAIANVGERGNFDFVLSSKMICEVIASGGGKNDNAYFDFVKKFLPLLNKYGILYLLDVTTRQKHSTYNPFLMNNQVNEAMKEMCDFCVISPIPCAIFTKKCTQNCFYQKEFIIRHSHVISDISKVAYKLISTKELSEMIGVPNEPKGAYLIHKDKVCPNINLKDKYLDAFLVEEGIGLNVVKSNVDVLVIEDKSVDTNIVLGDNDNTLNVEIEKETISNEFKKDVQVEDIVELEEDRGLDDEYYLGCYIIDTNVFLDKPDILSKISDDYFIVLSAKVLDELDHLKIKKNMSVARKKRVTKALKHISESMSDREIILEDSDVRLLPRDFDRNCPDNKILSVALKFMDENPILLTSDYGLQVRAKGLGIGTISLKDFVKNND